jgi:hypothetical protein
MNNDVEDPITMDTPITTTTPTTTTTTGNTTVNGNTVVGNTVATAPAATPAPTPAPAPIPETIYDEYDETYDPNQPLTFGQFVVEVFHASHIYVLAWFILIYLLVYVAIGYYFKNKNIENIDLIMSRTFDCMVVFPPMLYLLYKYYILSDDKKEHILINIWKWSIKTMGDIINFFGVLLFGLCFYVMIFVLKIPMTPDKMPYTIHLLEHKVWSITASYALLIAFKHIFGIDLLQILDKYVMKFMDAEQDFISSIKGENDYDHQQSSDMGAPPPSETSAPPPPPVKYDEVFNIGNNLYTYEDAQNICSIYGARLANYDEIEDSYNHGGEWCNYGWSDGQMVFFPTQKTTWDKLQKNPKLKNACGRPGINGGYIENPYIRFGVNCYGKRPDPKDTDLARMNQPINIPKTEQEIAMEQKMQFWKDNADKLVQINSFNNSSWSEF